MKKANNIMKMILGDNYYLVTGKNTAKSLKEIRKKQAEGKGMFSTKEEVDRAK